MFDDFCIDWAVRLVCEICASLVLRARSHTSVEPFAIIALQVRSQQYYYYWLVLFLMVLSHFSERVPDRLLDYGRLVAFDSCVVLSFNDISSFYWSLFVQCRHHLV